MKALRILRAIGFVTGGAALLVLAAYLAVTVDPWTVITWIAAIIVVACVLAIAAALTNRDPIGSHVGTSDPDEHLEPLLSGSAKVGRRMAAEMKRRGLILPNRASTAARKLVIALDRSRPASRGRLAFAMAARIARRLNRGIESFVPDEDRQAAREAFGTAARRGRHRTNRPPMTAPTMRIPAERDPFLAAPLALLPAGRMFAEKTLQREAPEGLPDQPADRLPLHTSLAQGQPDGEPEDPSEVLTDEEEADALVGYSPEYREFYGGPEGRLTATPVYPERCLAKPGIHCDHWFEGGQCCSCGPDGPDSSAAGESIAAEPEPVLDTHCGRCGKDWMNDPDSTCSCTPKATAPAGELYDYGADHWGPDSVVMDAIKIGTAPGRGGAGN
jgi:hypothetical protein